MVENSLTDIVLTPAASDIMARTSGKQNKDADIQDPIISVIFRYTF